MSANQSNFFPMTTAGVLALAMTLVASGCSLSAQVGDPSLSVDLSPLRDRASQLALLYSWEQPSSFGIMGAVNPAPSEVSHFKCYGLNVTGPGIADSSGERSSDALSDFQRTLTETNRSCNYRGVVTPPLLLATGVSAEASLRIPPGGIRLVQVIGVNDVQICESGVLGRDEQSGPNVSKYFEIGRAVLTDVYSDRSVSISTNWPSDNTQLADSLRAQRSIDCGDGVSAPITVLPPIITAIAAGTGHTCAVLQNNTVRCWGKNNFGQLGNEMANASRNAEPAEVHGIGGSGVLQGVIQIAAGGSHTCAVLTGGQIACWGKNEGRLGDGTMTPFTFHPVLVSGITNAQQVFVGETHTCALLAGGGVKCWGFNSSGQVGDGSTVTRSTPVAVLSSLGVQLSGITRVSLGTAHSCALKNDQTIRCWGGGSDLQLGAGGGANQLYANLSVSGLGNAVSVVTGSTHSCALLTSGDVKCWGNGANGRLGNGSMTSSITPMNVPGLSTGARIFAGGGFTCAEVGGTLRCWGANADGQLGDGTTIDRLSPVPTPYNGFTDVAVGGQHSCVLSGGSVSCVGRNSAGELGNLNVMSAASATPVNVVF